MRFGQSMPFCDGAASNGGLEAVGPARLRERGVYGLSRLHQRLKPDLREGGGPGRDGRPALRERPRHSRASCGATHELFATLP